jgi:glycosyltransferase involved in cell wall biosynthesis
MISIIIPAHNEEKLIGGLLEDIKRQKFGDFEVIVSNDFSDDGTSSVIRKCGIKNLRIVEHRSRNTAAARNIGAKKARGDVLIFLDADTRIDDTGFLGKAADAFYRKGAAACSVNILVHPDEETFSDRFFQNYFNWNIRLLTFLGVFASRGECQMVRRDIFEKAGGYNEKISVAEDVELFKRIRKFSRTTFLNSIRVYESPRRYRKDGYPMTILRWCYNGIYAFVFGKSITRSWEAVR